MEQVILVDTHDEDMGIMEKMEAHELGILHRAFSIFIFNKKGELLLQQRAFDKYHSGGLWTNTCCSHPRPQENIASAAHRRLQEEMGFDTDLNHAFSFIYKVGLDHGLTEHEYDHVFTGIYEAEIVANKDEVAAYTYKSIQSISSEIELQPQQFTEWFKIAFERVVQVFINSPEVSSITTSE